MSRSLGSDILLWKIYDPVIDRYQSPTDQVIRWPDGRRVRFGRGFHHRAEVGGKCPQAHRRVAEPARRGNQIRYYETADSSSVVSRPLRAGYPIGEVGDLHGEVYMAKFEEAAGRIMTHLKFAKEIEAIGL